MYKINPFTGKLDYYREETDLDGGFANSTYQESESIDGGGA